MAALTATAAGAATFEIERRSRGRQAAARFALADTRPLEPELRRVLAARLDCALEALDGAGDERVHDARVALKRARTVLALGRGQLGEDVYAREDRRLRDAGRLLAPARDALAAPGVLKTLVADSGGEQAVVAAELEKLRARLLLAATLARIELDSPAGPVAQARSALTTSRAAVDELPLAGISERDLAGAVRRIYRRGRQAGHRAASERTAESFHEWRKRVKDLRHCGELLRAADPRRMREMRRGAHELSDLLGDAHDLTVLERGAADAPTVIALITSRRALLEQSAFELGARAYRCLPRRVAKRLRRRIAKRTAWTRSKEDRDVVPL